MEHLHPKGPPASVAKETLPMTWDVQRYEKVA